MNIRKTRKFKEKPTILAFGHIMLPLVGLLALGLLILGIRLLFVTPGSEVSYPEPSIQTSLDPAPDIANETTTQQNEPLPAEIVAVPVPVQDGQEAVVDQPVADNTAPSAEPKKDIPPVKKPTSEKPLPPVSVSSGIWVVQIGAFTAKDSAEALVREVRGKKYEAVITKAEVGGKTYFRVRIGAGTQRSDAERLAKELAAKGYATLVTRQE